MKVQSSLDLNKFELRNAIVQQQAGPLAIGWKVGLLQLDTQNGKNQLMLGISDAAAGQGGYLERTNYLYLLDSRIGGIANDMLAGFSNQALDIESALASHFPSCAAVKTYVGNITSSAMIYKGTVAPSYLQKNTITCEAADYRFAEQLASGTYRYRWSNGSDDVYTENYFPRPGDTAHLTPSGGGTKRIDLVFSRIYADMFIEVSQPRTSLPQTKGWLYKCTGSGYFGDVRMEAGDTIICNGGTAGTTADYDVVQGNIDLLNIPELRVVVSGGKSVHLGINDFPDIGFINASGDGPTLGLVDNGSDGYLSLSCEGDDYNNLRTTGWIDAGALKENGTALASKYYLASNPAGYISGITKAMVEAVLTGSITSHSHNYIANAANAVLESHINAGAVTTNKIADAAVTNAKLANSALTIGSTSVALGSTAASLEGLTTVQVQELRIGDSGAYISLSYNETGSPAVIDVSGVLDASSLRENGTALSAKYLGISAKAADADKLDGLDSSAFFLAASAEVLIGAVGSNAAEIASLADSVAGITYDLLPLGQRLGMVESWFNASGVANNAANATNATNAANATNAQNATNADKLDGYHASAFLVKADGGTLNGDLEVNKPSGQSALTLSTGSGASLKSATISHTGSGVMTISPYGNLEIDGTVIPAESDSYDLGSAAKPWVNLYAETIYENGSLLSARYLSLANGGTVLGDVTIGASGSTKDLTVTGDLTAANVYASGLAVKASGQSDAYIVNENGRVTIDHTDGGGALGLEHLYPSNGESQIVVHGHIQPDSNGQLAIGSANSQFLDVYAEEFFENGASLSDKYAAKATTPKMFRTDITGNASTTTFLLTHNLGTQSPIVQIYEASTHELVMVDVVANTANTVQVTFGAAPANAKVYNVVIMG